MSGSKDFHNQQPGFDHDIRSIVRPIVWLRQFQRLWERPIVAA